MSNSEILNYFIGNVVYVFSGNVKEFQQMQASHNTSYNYIVVNGSIYFTSNIFIEDERVSILSEEQ
jgi:hypothetical protein